MIIVCLSPFLFQVTRISSFRYFFGMENLQDILMTNQNKIYITYPRPSKWFVTIDRILSDTVVIP